MKRFIYARISRSGVPEIRIIDAEDVLEASRRVVVQEYTELIGSDVSAVSMGCLGLPTPEQIVNYLALWGMTISVPVEIEKFLDRKSSDAEVAGATSLFADVAGEMSFEYMVNELDYSCDKITAAEIDHIKQIAAFVMLNQDKLPEEVSLTREQLLAKYPMKDTTPLMLAPTFRRKVALIRKMDMQQFLGGTDPICEEVFDKRTSELGLTNAGEFLADLYGSFCGVRPEVLLKAFFTCICSARIYEQVNGYSDFGDAVWMIARHKHE